METSKGLEERSKLDPDAVVQSKASAKQGPYKRHAKQWFFIRSKKRASLFQNCSVFVLLAIAMAIPMAMALKQIEPYWRNLWREEASVLARCDELHPEHELVSSNRPRKYYFYLIWYFSGCTNLDTPLTSCVFARFVRMLPLLARSSNGVTYFIRLFYEDRLTAKDKVY